ncbi:energy-coupling factor ABC transporter permease [Mycolicibacterium smegmatis]|uniref:energy-coupling factor ABC transporter permease n=1 Tax=Mycolicibacterium smegmatis TaxID=1772 RepID=UPI0005D7A735|nr:energy-coupling factor ABC transporter permease [Mycolicibacterium smegmatis]MDF1901092.1 energy-coupling factor ABC transporter permease [Mycolicibacterium smegmatis]MDF1907268.1 energy-coupling factor ABC transporter permease [Mycolicibacterium smegmatis]MDF1917540.1 energy-coupling factor ABC transporter permease [Mycolicibacterium smegmatis]MDF1925530.1 energy-coupling factor ABC transporter permease [Mycolicibacterium smegmatis]UAK54638.1 energy-coupling factor ABC transporter permease
MAIEIVAMHMSDGIVNVQTSLVFGALAVAALGVCALRARDELDERTVPLAGLVAAFIFAVQMVNFPILPGVSGHLLGGALAAILVGPYTGALCIAIVLVVQSLLFADGGVSALGTNITNMALIGVAVGYATAVVLSTVLRGRGAAGSPPDRHIGVVAFVAALVGTVCAAMGFVVEYVIGGVATTSIQAVAGYMFGTHVLIGIGEGIITALTVTAVARVRPDLVYLLRRQRQEVAA